MMKVSKRLITLLLALAMLAGMCTALAADGSEKVKLRSTGVMVRHYITYSYGNGDPIDSTKALPGENYNAWLAMSDADKRAVTKWYSGFYSQMQTQFGYSGAKDMLEFANENSGWKDAGDTLRSRLAARNYPALYAFYGDPDSPNPSPVNLDDGTYTGLTGHTASEWEQFQSDTNDFNVAYTEGLEAWRRLINLKQAQTNTAVTAVSSGLIDIILDNMIPPKDLGSLKDAAKGFIDKGLGVSDGLKSFAKKYTGVAWLTGEDRRIDAAEAAKAIEMYWKLMAAWEDYAQAGMITCQRMQEDLKAQWGDLLALDERRAAEEEQVKAKRQAAIENAKYKDAVYLSTYREPPIDTTRQEGESDSEYHSRLRQAAVEWALPIARQTEESYVSLRGAWQPYLNDRNIDDTLNPDISGILDVEEGTYEPRALWGQLDGMMSVLFKDFKAAYINEFKYAKWFNRHFAREDYKNSMEQLETIWEQAITKMEARAQEADRIAAAWDDLTRSFPADVQPLRNVYYSLSEGTSFYGDWGSSFFFDYFDEMFKRDMVFIQNRRDEFLDRAESSRRDAEVLRQELDDFRQKRKEFEANKRLQWQVFKEAEDDMNVAMASICRNVESLRALRRTFPAYLTALTGAFDVNVGDHAINNRNSWKLWTDYFEGKTEAQQRALATDIISQIDDIPIDETYYIEQIDSARAVIRAAAKTTHYKYYQYINCFLSDNELQNLRDLFGDFETYPELVEKYSLNDYIGGNMEFKGRIIYGDYRDESHTTRYEIDYAYWVQALLDDLQGYNSYMTQMRQLYADVLKQKGTWMRYAAQGAWDSDIDAAVKKYNTILASAKGGEQKSGSKVYSWGSFAWWNVSDYYNDKIKPVIDDVRKVYDKTTAYKELLRLDRGPTLMDDGDLNLSVGETAKLTVTYDPVDATIRDLYWESSDNEVARVDENGVVTALAPGEVAIKAIAADSPENYDISVDFAVTVTADGFDSLAEAVADRDELWCLVSPRLTIKGNTVSASGVVVFNSEEDGGASVALLCAVYDGDRFLGSDVVTAEPLAGVGASFRAEVTLDNAPQDPVMKVFLVGDVDMIPLEGFDALVIEQ